MPALERGLRGRLDRSVREARDIAEAGARAVLQQLGVGEANPPAHLTPEQQELRRKLRIHGRQLGDLRDGITAVQELDRLLEEVAYEHWHRMLFARFLAENNLLMHTGHGVPIPVTLEECQELAPGEGARDGWELAARFASKMLPQIFRPDSPVFLIELPPEHQQRLEKLLADLPVNVFTASDSLGWVYQFWQAKRKKEINDSNVKIGARELPAVTQLFTEPYMVSFLLDNSLGAWWAARRLTEHDLATAETEDELRQKASLPGMPLEYLRFIRKEGESKWSPASGSFPGWPEELADFKMLDPCCGSGHFLVAILSMLVPMRMELEGITAREATDLVLSQNIHGLEIDRRCVELAAFNLALAAWKYPEAGGYRILPELNIACTGIGPQCSADQWINLAEQSGLPIQPNERERIKNGLLNLHRLFSQAPTLGSLINPSDLPADLMTADYEMLQPYLTAINKVEKTDDEIRERAIAAAGMSKAADILTNKFTLISTNFPFLGLERQCQLIADKLKSSYGIAKRELATSFLVRISHCCSGKGVCAIVMPGEWTFARPHRHFRAWLLSLVSINFLNFLGRDAFVTGLRTSPVLLIVSWQRLSGLSITADIRRMSLTEKASACSSGLLSAVSQEAWLNTPDSRILLDGSESMEPTRLDEYADARLGVSAGDGLRFERFIWEIQQLTPDWEYLQGAVPKDIEYSGRHGIVFWQGERGEMVQLAKSVRHLNHAAQNWQRGRPFWGRWGVVLSQMGGFTVYSGDIFDSRCLAVMPNDQEHVLPTATYALSGELKRKIQKYDDGFKIGSPQTVLDVPFDLAHWTQVAAEKYPNGLPRPYTDDPTQWIFHGHPCGSVIWSEESKWTAFGELRTDSSVLQVAVARLLGYRWPAELDPKMELSDESRVLVAKCDELLGFADKDGIVSIPAHRGEPSAADRLVNLLAAAYGKEWSNERLMELLASADHAGKTLESWLRDKFFAQHCAMFHQRPFIWHIWDGLKDGFSVLVNYHKLDRKNLETLIYSYLGDWITRQRQEVASGIDGAQDRLAAAEQLKKRLELIQEGEAPYDIFVRWKPLEKQPIGWDPDINDGVRLNIRPFVTVPDVGKKGAGVLRDKPRIHWEKDRGKDVQSAPWFPLFKGDRINDHHLTLVEKNEARRVKP